MTSVARKPDDAVTGPALVRVVIADPQPVYRTGLRSALDGVPDVRVVAEAGDAGAALRGVGEHRPQVVLLDPDLPGAQGNLLRSLLALPGAPRVVILTSRAAQESLVPSLEQGARGFLSKNVEGAEVRRAVRQVAAGELYVQSPLATLLAQRMRARLHPDPDAASVPAFDRLSDREACVLRLTALGYNGPEIGAILGVSVKTVDTYKHRIEGKLGLSHRREYVRFAYEMGLMADTFGEPEPVHAPPRTERCAAAGAERADGGTLRALGLVQTGTERHS